jgi:hypothetical protein
MYMGFSAAADLISTPLDRAAPLTAAVRLAVDVGLHSHWVVMLDLGSVALRRASALPLRCFPVARPP